MFHRIPQTLLQNRSAKQRLIILDPFCGSGTVLVEAIALGHDAIGLDVNPLARSISSVKTTAIDTKHLQRHLPHVLKRTSDDVKRLKSEQTLDYWFKPSIRSQLGRLKRSIDQIAHPACKSFYLMSLSSIIRKCSLADPAIPPPVRLNPERVHRASKRYKEDLRRAKALKTADVTALFIKAIEANMARLETLNRIERLGAAQVIPAPASAADTKLPNESVDMIITSPPYCGAQKYVRSLRLEMLILGYTPTQLADIDRLTLGSERPTTTEYSEALLSLPWVSLLFENIRSRNPSRSRIFANYVSYLELFATEVHRILRPGGEAFVTFGTDSVAGYPVDCGKIFSDFAERCGLRHVSTLVDQIPSRGMMTNRHYSAGTIHDERVVWLRKLQ